MDLEVEPEIPAYPQLSPGIELVPISEHQLLVRFFGGTLILKGEVVETILPQLISRLNGQYSLLEICQDLVDIPSNEILEILKLFLRKGILLNEKNTLAVRPLNKFGKDHQASYWAVHQSSQNDPIDRLRTATVAVVGLGGVGACVSRILALSCVGRVIGIDPLTIDPSDLIFGYGADQIGQLRTNALAAQFTLAGSGTTFVPISEGFYENKLESLCDNKPDVLVRCDDSMSLNGYDAINSFCISYNLPWVSARIDRSEATIGPFIYPNETACFTCFELRSRANSPQPSDHESLYRHWKTIGGISAEWPILAPEPMMVASYIVHDLLRFLSGQIPVTLGRVLNIDFRSLESKFHEVLKLPRCPTCSRWQKRPLTQIWDIRTQDNDITSAKKI